MDIRKSTAIKVGDTVIGNRARVKVIKNKMAPPFKVAEFDIMYNEGISKTGSILDVATDMGIIEKRGSWFSFEGEQLGQGRDQTKVLLGANPELQQKIHDKIIERIDAEKAAAAASRSNAETTNEPIAE
jgi:recombination protein RecA